MEAILRLNEVEYEKESLIHRIGISICIVAGLVFLYTCAVTGMMDQEYKLEASASLYMKSGAGTDGRIDENIEVLNRAKLPKAAVTEGVEEITILREGGRANEQGVDRNVVLEKSFVNSGSAEEENQIGGQEDAIPASSVCTVRLHGNGGMPELSVHQEQISDVGASWTNPRRLGKEFCGWYRDAACTIPYEGVEEGISELDLYAGWKDFAGFISDERGYLIGCTSELLVTDGIFLLPVSSDCVGIASGAFDGMDEAVLELYISANITEIEEGALDSLKPLWYIEVDPANPSYYSEDGVLYHRNGAVVKDPFTD